ncbi:unnamed protein product [Haemonchus placei]|uniref:Reverse transcriptase n=1 Tax=Haemonchus placei TaxID=6290 RepID=A0A0N4XA06_HAEPC|nr:unnamed protein product [Haemonchus placei]
MKLSYDKAARPTKQPNYKSKPVTGKQGLARKLCFPWIGQFRVIKIDPPHAVIVSITSSQSKPRRVHLNQIKKVLDCCGPASTLPQFREKKNT